MSDLYEEYQGNQNSHQDENTVAGAIINNLRYALLPNAPNTTQNARVDLYRPLSSENEEQDPLFLYQAVKRDILNKSLEDLLAMIEDRQKLRDAHLETINQDIAKKDGRLLHLSWVGYHVDPRSDTMRRAVEQDIVALNKDKRAVETACWRDITRLQSDVREKYQELAQEQKKQWLVSGYAP